MTTGGHVQALNLREFCRLRYAAQQDETLHARGVMYNDLSPIYDYMTSYVHVHILYRDA